MPITKDPNFPKRNETCPCGSGLKFKRCHGFNAGREAAPAGPGVGYIDSGEPPVRWVITNSTGTGFFSDEYNKILVFTDKAAAFAVAHLEEFSGQEPGEINVAGVGETKFTHLRETLPFIEVSDVEHAVRLVRGRIEARRAELETHTEGTTDGNQNQDQNQEQASGQQDGGPAQEAPDQGREGSAGQA